MSARSYIGPYRLARRLRYSSVAGLDIDNKQIYEFDKSNHLDLGERSDKNQRNFENFAQKFSPLNRIRTLLSPELGFFSGVRAALRDTPCMWEGYETSVTPEILPSSARKWISVMGPNGFKISPRYLN